MKSSRQWVIYSLIRLGIFAVALALLLILGINVWIAAIGAAIIGFCISYIFLRGPRDAVARTMVKAKASPEQRSAPDRDLDNDIENEALDRLESKKLDE
ncbi:MAG TPA: DUF4229 domain-containing protein [Lacisediminihabitans sp.]|uniref:DUF4229 domain-containing protein n=1 Tax=Lacisediminihabitans sp. TaxID=2787631 RepID=UPI002EDB261B